MKRVLSEAAAPVSVGSASGSDTLAALDSLADQIHRDDSALTVFFASSAHDLDALRARALQRFGDSTVIGCTTAGEMGSQGYLDGSITGFSFARGHFVTETMLLDLESFQIADGRLALNALRDRLRRSGREPSPQNTFAFLLIDGMSRREEVVTHGLHQGLDGISLFGGSAADGGAFETTHVFHDGAFRSRHAVLALVHTTLPFHVFKTQHFASSDQKLVVTRADPTSRTVYEINGLPAAEEYARMIDLDPGTLSQGAFAAHPVVVRVGGTQYVRSIMRMNPDGSLEFACAIDEGIVLSVAKGVSMLDNLKDTFAQIRARVGTPVLTIACDCLFRKLEMDQKGLRESISGVLRENQVVGFATYGEQFNGMHVNQTFTGVAIGRPRAGS